MEAAIHLHAAEATIGLGLGEAVALQQQGLGAVDQLALLEVLSASAGSLRSA